MTIATLRKIQDETPAEESKPVRPAPTAWPTATPAPATDHPLPVGNLLAWGEQHQAAEEKPQPLPVGKLLAWGEAHADADVRDQATRIRMSLAGLRRRYDVDQELGLLTLEEEQLRTRLAEIEARTSELTPKKPGRKPSVKRKSAPTDFNYAEVRDWARQHGYDVHPTGRPKTAVVDAWRAATGK